MIAGSGKEQWAAFLALAPASLNFSLVVIDDETQQLRSLLIDTLLQLGAPVAEDTQHACPVDFRVFYAPASDMDELLRRVDLSLATQGCSVLLVNAMVDPQPPGDTLYSLVARYGWRAPFRLFLFAPEDFIELLRKEFMPRGMTAVLPLTGGGLEQWANQLVELQTPSRLHLTQPTVCSTSRWHLTPEQQDTLRLLFPAEKKITISDIAGGGAAARRFAVATGNGRRYFVKLGRWDNLSEEYGNYLDLIQGKHENYAGRALGPPMVRGSEAALSFSLASTGDDAGTVSLRRFLADVDESRGAEFLTNLNTRLVRNLHLTRAPRFVPQKFLSVLPALLTVKNARFVPYDQDSIEDTSLPGRSSLTRVFSPSDQPLRGPSLRHFLEQSEDTLSRREQPEVLLQGLTIQEVRFAPETDTVIVQLTDGADRKQEVANYKVNVHLATSDEVSGGALFSSLKLHQGRQVWVRGVITETLLSLARHSRPSWDLGEDQQWEPMMWLYDFLFGYQDTTQEKWRESPLAELSDAPLGDFTHGDFNLTNVLVEQRKNENAVPWLIDFEKSSGDFYPASDWAKLEVEIATHLTPPLTSSQTESTMALLVLEHSLWCPRRIDGEWLVPDASLQDALPLALQKVVKLENTVRRLAAQKLTSQRFADYLWAVCCHSLRAMGRAPTDLGKVRVYVKAAIACKRIKQILR